MLPLVWKKEKQFIKTSYNCILNKYGIVFINIFIPLLVYIDTYSTVFEFQIFRSKNNRHDFSLSSPICQWNLKNWIQNCLNTQMPCYLDSKYFVFLYSVIIQRRGSSSFFRLFYAKKNLYKTRTRTFKSFEFWEKMLNSLNIMRRLDVIICIFYFVF